MAYMARFTHDLETIDLGSREVAAFAHMVQYACHLHEQHLVSVMLSRVTRSVGLNGTDLVVRQASRMWRTER